MRQWRARCSNRGGISIFCALNSRHPVRQLICGVENAKARFLRNDGRQWVAMHSYALPPLGQEAAVKFLKPSHLQQKF
jgi:hypothetical protein